MVKGEWPCRWLKYIDYTTGSARLFSGNPAESAFGGVQWKRCPFDSVSIKAGACLFPHFLLCPGIAFHHHYRQRPAIWEICRPLLPSITSWPLVVHSITRKTNTLTHTCRQTGANCKSKAGWYKAEISDTHKQLSTTCLKLSIHDCLVYCDRQVHLSDWGRHWAVVAWAEIHSMAFSRVSCRNRINVHQDAWGSTMKTWKYL